MTDEPARQVPHTEIVSARIASLTDHRLTSVDKTGPNEMRGLRDLRNDRWLAMLIRVSGSHVSRCAGCLHVLHILQPP